MVDLDAPCNAFRLNFSTASNEDIEKGIEILGNLLKEEIR
jgi:DNA-binding transcriptional MocR family regulator